MNARFVRLAEGERPTVRLLVDGEPIEALQGDTLMVALLTRVSALRQSEFPQRRASARLFQRSPRRAGHRHQATGGDMATARLKKCSERRLAGGDSGSGIESYLPDSLSIMGPSGTVAGLYYAFGFSGHGFQLGPGVGDVMAELISSGSTSTSIEPFHILRFATSSLQRSKAL